MFACFSSRPRYRKPRWQRLKTVVAFTPGTLIAALAMAIILVSLLFTTRPGWALLALAALLAAGWYGLKFST